MKPMTIAGMIFVAALAAFSPAGADDKKATVLLQAAQAKETVQGDLMAAIELYGQAVKEAGANRALAAKALVEMAECYQKMGDGESRKIYERVLRDYGDQKEAVALAQARLATMTPARYGEAAAMSTRRLWSGPEVNPVGSVSPDGRYLTFVHMDTGDLGLRELATGQNRRLTNNGNWATDYAEESVFSPDGKQIAYAWFTNTFYELRIQSLGAAQATKPRVLLRNEEFSYNQPCAWTPDGKHIVAILSRRDRTNQIAMVSVLDGSVRVLKSLEWRYPNKLSLSPDGRYIVYDAPVERGSQNRDIYLLSFDGSREIPLVQHPAVDRAPVWTPDGQSVLFASDRTGSLGLWMIRVVDGRPEGVPELVKGDMGAFEPKGIAGDASYYYSTGGVMREGYTAELDPATGRTTRPAAPVSEFCLSSPDGQYSACIQRPVGGVNLLTIGVRSLKSNERREIPTKLTNVAFSMRWFPDGKSLLVIGGNFNAGIPFSVHRFDVQTGEDLIKGTIQARFGSDAGVSPDCKRIYYSTYDDATKTGRIMVHEIETGKDSETYKVSPQKTNIAVSRDGREIAFVLIDEATLSTSLHVMHAEGGPAREVFRGARGEATGLFGIEWMQDGKHLLFAKPAEPGSKDLDLWRLSIDTGQAQPLGLGRGFELIAGPRLDPEGRSVSFMAGKKRWEIWVMKNILPSAAVKR